MIDKTIKKFYNLAKNELFPIHRSITGKGIKKTLRIIKKSFPKLKIKNIRSGTKVFDWIVPQEWNINQAYVLDKNGKKIIDYKKNNLHIVSYSTNVNNFFKKKYFFKRIFSLPKMPNAIPYVNSYYKKFWGFCITNKEKKYFNKIYKDNDKFKVVIDSNFNKSGSLTYGELLIPGKSKQEIFISTYICHPSMANNELSGPIVSMCLINFFLKKKLNKTLRFIFIPETIGSISYINKNLKHLKDRVVGGYNLTCIGDNREYSCILSKFRNTAADKSLLESFKKLKINFKEYSFLDRGSDERQYNSPGVDLPIASIFRTKYAEYPEYHTSFDDFNLVTEKGIKGGFLVAKTAIEILDKKIIPKYKIFCEPKLSKKKLYPTITTNKKNLFSKRILDFLQYSDGKSDLSTISNLIKIKYDDTLKIFNILKKNKLIFY